MNSVLLMRCAHTNTQHFREKRAAFLAGLGRAALRGFGRAAIGGASSVLRSPAVNAVGNAALKSMGRASTHVLNHPKVYGPLLKLIQRAPYASGIGAGAAVALRNHWVPQVTHGLQSMFGRKRISHQPQPVPRVVPQQLPSAPPAPAAPSTPLMAVKHSSTAGNVQRYIYGVHLLTPAMREKQAWVAPLLRLGSGIQRGLRSVSNATGLTGAVNSWRSGANAIKATQGARTLRSQARSMPLRSAPQKELLRGARSLEKGVPPPLGFLGKVRYGLGAMNPANTRIGGALGSTYRTGLPLAFGLGGYGMGAVDGAERGAAKAISSFEQMPWWQHMAFGAPNFFGHRQMLIDRALDKRQQNASFLERLLGPNSNDIKGHIDRNRQQFQQDRMNQWNQWGDQIKSVFS